MCVAATQDWAAVAAQCGLALERGPYSRPLWQPAPMLRALLPTIEAQLPPAMPRVCVDLGCGGGRDTVFLALRGWRVVAIDQHPRLLQRLQHFATNAGLTAEQQAQRLRLEAHTFGADDNANRAYLQQLGAEEAPALLLCVRFLFRPILDHLLLSLRPGWWRRPGLKALYMRRIALVLTSLSNRFNHQAVSWPTSTLCVAASCFAVPRVQ